MRTGNLSVYLLNFTPFLFAAATLPLTMWTLTIMPVYTVWEIARHGGRWVVPTGLMAAEYRASLRRPRLGLRRSPPPAVRVLNGRTAALSVVAGISSVEPVEL